MLLVVAAVAAFVALRGGGDDVEVVLATEIDEVSGAPLNNVEFVGSGVTLLYAAVAIEDADRGEVYRFEWHGGDDELDSEHELPEDVDAGWVFSALENERGLAPGDAYEVEVFRDGDRIARRSFEVTE
jgi:hypothetical protein